MPELTTAHLSIPAGIKDALEGLRQKYEILKFDAKGGIGHTFFGRNRLLSNDVAIKFYYWGGESKFHAEPQALMEIRSPNVLKIQDAGYADGDYAYFVTPYCSGGDLDDQLASGHIGLVRAGEQTSQILGGLGHLHQARFVHRDIKPLNIFLEDGSNAVIGDFGSLKRIPEGHTTIPASSLARIYAPPESLNGGKYGFAGDQYQAGIIYYQLLGGYFPYDEVAWLSERERASYGKITSYVDRTIFANDCIDRRIAAGRALEMSSLPFWVGPIQKAIVRRACHPNPMKRFASVAAFQAKIYEAGSSSLDWSIIDGIPTCTGNTSYRVIGDDEFIVEKRGGGAWRRDNSFASMTKDEIANVIAERQRR